MPRPLTPGRMVKSPGPTRPTSPPQTPQSASASKHQKNRKGNWGGRSRQSKQQQVIRDQLSHHHFGAQFMDDLDDGPVFGFRPGPPGPDRLSPRSTLSFSENETEDEAEAGVEDGVEGDDEEEDDYGDADVGLDLGSSASESPPPSCSSRQFIKSSAGSKTQTLRKGAFASDTKGNAPRVVTAHIIVEPLEIREYDGSDDDNCIVIRPDAIEDADTERSRSRSRSRSRQRRDSNMASGMRDLNVFASSDDDDIEETEHEKKMREHREERRRARMSSGSITKRTISERGSDSDSEDLANGHGLPGPQDPGDAAHRRLRRRLARNSILPAAPRIDEADEPDSSDEERDILLARELSFFNYIFMEVDSP